MMDTRDCACGQTTVRDEAALWFTRVQDAPLNPGDQQRFSAWLEQHPQHRDEYQLLQGLWSATELVPKARLQALCETPPTRLKRRPLLQYAVAASVLAVAVGIGLFNGLAGPASYRAEFATALGERRQVSLPDGSLIELNSRSQVRVNFQGDQRGIELTQGEAMFNVAHDSNRPLWWQRARAR